MFFIYNQFELPSCFFFFFFLQEYKTQNKANTVAINNLELFEVKNK